MPEMAYGLAFTHARRTRPLRPGIAVEWRLRPSISSILQRRQNSLERVFEFHALSVRKIPDGLF
jgi:hypothetical protein